MDFRRVSQFGIKRGVYITQYTNKDYNLPCSQPEKYMIQTELRMTSNQMEKGVHGYGCELLFPYRTK